MNRTVSVDDIRFPDMYMPGGNIEQKNVPGEKRYMAAHELLNGWLYIMRKKTDLAQPAAVFDFDNTCIFNDVGKAVFEYQLDHFLFRHTVESFAGLFPHYTGILGGISLAKIRQQLIYLYRDLSSLPRRQPLAVAPDFKALNQFKLLFLWYVDEARNNPLLGPEYTLTLLARLLAGYSVAEVGRITIQALQKAMEEPVGVQTRSIRLPPPVGNISVTTQQGIRVFPGMVNLMQDLKKSGIRCSVISASTQWVVENSLQYLGFPVEREDVYGIRLTLDRRGVLQTNLPEKYPVTYRTGKRQILENFVSGTPVFVAGDAVTDYEMLTLPIPVRLIIDHAKPGLIRELINSPGYLVQPVDRKRGTFCPSGEKGEITSMIITEILKHLLQTVPLTS